MHTVYLAALSAGFVLSVLLVVLGGAHGSGAHHGAGHLGHHAHGSGGGHGAHPQDAGGHGHGGHTGETLGGALLWTLSWLSPLTLSGFALLFGGAGLLAEGTGFAVIAAILAGLIGAILIRTFLGMLQGSSTPPLVLTADGAIGTVNATIRQGGTGEVVYTLEGLHRALAARTEAGRELPRGTPVVITHVERGIAWVEPLDPFTERDQ